MIQTTKQKATEARINEEGRQRHQAWMLAEFERRSRDPNHIWALARRGVHRYRSPWYQRFYDDNRVPPMSYALERIRKYDPAVRFRWNMLKHRWELWRYRASGLTRLPERAPVRPIDIVHQMEYIGDVEDKHGQYCDVDLRVLVGLYKQDMWRISSDPNVVATEMDRIDKRRELSEDGDLMASCLDWATDNRFQMGRLAGVTRMISHGR
jgi:hypothetical protein